MKSNIGVWATAIMLAGTLGALTAQAAPASKATTKGPTEITGCLEQGPAAKDYVLRASDGTTWGVREKDMMMNNYISHEVTVAGDVFHPTASERTAAGTNHFLRAYDLVVDSDTCSR